MGLRDEEGGVEVDGDRRGGGGCNRRVRSEEEGRVVGNGGWVVELI